MPFTRRQFAALAGVSVLSIVAGRSLRARSSSVEQKGARIRARPRANVRTSIEGSRSLGLDPVRDAVLQVPPDVSKPVPLLIALHGATQSGSWMHGVLSKYADTAGVALLTPTSREMTWDGIHGSFDVDVAFIDRALERTYQLVSVDPARVVLGGFSDGASYGLSLGLMNGDAFHKLVAFSPGFIVDGPAAGKPEIFISHGTADQILPIDQCSRRIVPALRARGYTVEYREFDGPHTVPDTMAKEAFTWLAK
ncbi:MAG TPA: hypothetical protein VE967_00875 [Gemmatimonadaceae bacterium]|nr:hypothetical protein [Gemmatimonadaceae bacterium]